MPTPPKEGEGHVSRSRTSARTKTGRATGAGEFGGVEVIAWTSGKVREAWDGPPGVCAARERGPRAAEGLIRALKRRNGRGAKEPQSKWF